MVEEQTLHDIVASITEAFPPHPLDPSPRRVWADTYLDMEAFHAGLQGKRWDELDRKFMEFHGETIHALEPPAFAELLPAFLVTVIRHEEQLDMLPTFLLTALTPPATLPGRLPHYLANLASLTGVQRKALLSALEYLASKAKYEDTQKEARGALVGVRSSFEELTHSS